MVTCENCGTEAMEGDNFCRHCGEELADDVVTCECGAEVLPNDNFCHNCGSSFSGEIEESEDSGDDGDAMSEAGDLHEHNHEQDHEHHHESCGC